MRQVYAFARLPTSEKKLLFRALFLLIAYRTRLKTTPLRTLYISVTQTSPRTQQTTPPYITISPKRIAGLLQSASRVVPFTTCLSMALVGKILFAENGYRSEIHIGVHNDSSIGFGAHAWLSLDGAIVLGQLPDLKKYKEFPSFSCVAPE